MFKRSQSCFISIFKAGYRWLTKQPLTYFMVVTHKKSTSTRLAYTHFAICTIFLCNCSKWFHSLPQENLFVFWKVTASIAKQCEIENARNQKLVMLIFPFFPYRYIAIFWWLISILSISYRFEKTCHMKQNLTQFLNNLTKLWKHFDEIVDKFGEITKLTNKKKGGIFF